MVYPRGRVWPGIDHPGALVSYWNNDCGVAQPDQKRQGDNYRDWFVKLTFSL